MAIRWIKVYDFETHGEDPQQLHTTRVLNIDGKRYCMARTENGYFALDNRCPHAGAWLGEGWCEKNQVVCPIHRFKYDVETGRGAPGQGDFVETYPVKIDETGVYLGIKGPPWWKIW